MKKDYYNILGVNKTAKEAEIKKAYKKLAMQWHPDRHQGDNKAEEKFKEINEAYQVLSDTEKRQKYDTFGTADFGNMGGGWQSSQGFDFGDIFKVMLVVVHRRDLNLISEIFLVTSLVARNLHKSRPIMMIFRKRAWIWSKWSSSPSGISFSGQKSPSIHHILENSRSLCRNVPNQAHDWRSQEKVAYQGRKQVISIWNWMHECQINSQTISGKCSKRWQNKEKSWPLLFHGILIGIWKHPKLSYYFWL